MIKRIFSKNLKKLRLLKGYTQKTLGEKLGYSEKSICKWESTHCLPPVEVMVKIARILDCTIDSLLRETKVIKYYLGIDGGATKTDFVLTDTEERIVAQLQKASCNPNDIGFDLAMCVLEEGIREICRDIDTSCVSAFAGISGGTVYKTLFKQLLSSFRFACLEVDGDIQNIISAGLDENDGIALIIGTGAVAYGVFHGERKRTGGWGYLFDKGGSSYDLGRDAISAALSMYDGTGCDTILNEMLEEQIGTCLVDSLSVFYTKGKRYIASFAPLVFKAYRLGDSVAKLILKRNAKQLAVMIENSALFYDCENGMIPVVISGGMTEEAEILYPMIREDLPNSDRYEFRTLDVKPVMGAVKTAKKLVERGLSC